MVYRSIRRFLVVLLLGWGALVCDSHATLESTRELDRADYDLASSTTSWSTPPGSSHRLYLDIYNVSDYFDLETSNATGLPAGTFLADTVRPTATILWDDRFRIQLGVIALRGYGDDKGFGFVDPWIQLLWQPIKPLTVVLGNLNTPHYYLPALFYPLNYVRLRTNETGAQVLVHEKDWYDDLFFDYRQQDTVEHNEKFALGFVHRNEWQWLRFNYQSHWIHQGGEINPHTDSTINDVANTVGSGIHIPWGSHAIVGGDYYHMFSHYRIDSGNPDLNVTRNGDGNMWELSGRWNRFKLSYAFWRGHNFFHEGGDSLFTLHRVDLLTFRWDILLSRDFNLLLNYTAYFVGNNDQNVSYELKSTIHLQAAWQFSIPLMEWTTPAASPQGQPIPTRWDQGL